MKQGEKMSDIPQELKYTKSHEWIRVEEDDSVTIGITDHAQGLLGDMVFVELPDVGDEFEAQQECAVVESVKAASDIYSPIEGEVLAVNEELEDAPEQINVNAYYEGWLFRLRPSKMSDLDNLMNAEDYAEIVAAEEQ
jgi:glycine cleavage system H protein